MELRRTETSFYPPGEKLTQLLDDISRRRLQPEDKYEIAAILESDGWTDKRAMEEFGIENVFALASDLWDIAEKNFQAMPYTPAPQLGFIEYIRLIIKSFFRGMIFALPMAISIISMLTLRFSLWSYKYLSTEMATAIAIGTIMSFMAVGGFMQAIARRGFLYINQGFFTMARQSTFYFVRLGYLICAAIALLFFIFNLFFGIFPLRISLLTIGFFFFLSAIWFSVTIMYILEKELTVTGLMGAGIFTVYILFEVFKLNIIVSQLIAISLIAIAGIAVAIYFFKRAEAQLERGIAPSLPRSSITIYTVLPYFTYGFLYFSFLYVDRIIAWSVSSTYMPYLIWFRGHYELGLDLAVLNLIVPMGFIEVVVKELMINLESHQKNTPGYQVKYMGRMYMRRYAKRALLVAIFTLLSSLAIYFIIRYVSYNPNITIQFDLLENNTIHFVFIIALLAYAILSMALMNALILFCLSRPELVSLPLFMSLLANMLVGFPLSRWIDHSYAVVGLLLGSGVFLYLTTKEVWNVLGTLDYHLYASS